MTIPAVTNLIPSPSLWKEDSVEIKSKTSAKLVTFVFPERSREDRPDRFLPEIPTSTITADTQQPIKTEPLNGCVKLLKLPLESRRKPKPAFKPPPLRKKKIEVNLVAIRTRSCYWERREFNQYLYFSRILYDKY
jgi:hypothetical protein